MALIAMAVYDTEENKRTDYTDQTLRSISQTVDLNVHRMIVVDNNSCEATKDLLKYWKRLFQHKNFEVITLPENIGTARAVNKAWETRRPGEHAIKMDNDVVIHSIGWVDKLVDCIDRDPVIGIIGLKRKDLIESPTHENPFYQSELSMLPHDPGQPWLVVEKVNHVMGTCQMFNSALLDKIGFLYQPQLYGFDDALAAPRCHKAGFYNCFYPHIIIDHIDTGETPYQKWKEGHAGESMNEFNRLKNGYMNGTIDIYYPSNY